MKRERAALFARLQRLGVVLVVAWVVVHTLLMWATGWSVWRLGGLAMYGEPEFWYRGAAIVACGTFDCEVELRNTRRFASEDLNAVPVWRADSSQATGYDFVGKPTPRGDPQGAQLAFNRFPRQGTAISLLRMFLPRPCNSYLVVHYRQRVSLISREATVDARPFVVAMPPCR